MMSSLLALIYLLASIGFIVGLKMLSRPDTARKGNWVAAAGMAAAIFGTIFLYSDAEVERLGNYGYIFVALIVGSVGGWWSAKRVKMTAMPELVSLFNGMGGACAALISGIEFNHLLHPMHATAPATSGQVLIIVLGLVIGTVSFVGSMVAWGKLNGRVKDFSFGGQLVVNLVLLACMLGLSVYFVMTAPGFLATANYATPILVFALVLSVAIAYGVLFVLPIGGADMPVVISLLNSFTGVAAACGGFLYSNKAMLTGGILVGAAGTLLTLLMCKAMNRSLANVLIGSFGGGSKTQGQGGQAITGSYKQISLSDAAVVLSYANKVFIVPGYGLAVAQAQHVCHELEKLLEEKGVEVKYAIHPVAGRMPGHMNVLLAESDVPYEKLLEMEQANDEFSTTDAVLILGANDVVNPAAKTDTTSPIYGMPILEVEKAKTVIVNKRSMKPGYAGIENQLFFQPKTSMLFGDGKKVLQDLVAEIKNL
ncbi:MAG: NAD(P)(+) transhydrogenase (Re/Si-specific) subunit beta [Bacteroidetes bacterium]|nr:MAG: NAD(P)(+) transhydrogenase (Re/Si-specific) subunit beta [Bacteroidota bacterium]